jgi:hypothetical protein
MKTRAMKTRAIKTRAIKTRDIKRKANIKNEKKLNAGLNFPNFE